jgi:SAM-dependent methyltransferase
MDAAAHWETHAGEWIDWARTPGVDAYWHYRDAFRAFLPPPGRATLDLGCGEGRVARDLTDLGHHVTATDVAPSLLAAAEAAGSAERYVVADGAALPFEDGAFDQVVAYNVLMDVPDVPAVVAEAARVLAPGGTLTVSIVHPFFDRGTFTGPEDDAPFVVGGSYLEREPFAATATQDGHTMAFAGWAQPLQNHVGALTGAGLVISGLSEPRAAGMPRWQRLPLFLWMKATKQ